VLDALTMDLADTHPLRTIESFIVRACRRAYRIGGLALIVLVRRLGFRSALPAPGWLLPDPNLSALLDRLAPYLPATAPPGRAGLEQRRVLRGLARLRRTAAHRRPIPRAFRAIWP
jgi:hypothetical protein